MQDNHGHMPGEAKGKRVRVRLRNGYDTLKREPAGWPAEGCCWALRGDYPFDIVQFEVIA